MGAEFGLKLAEEQIEILRESITQLKEDYTMLQKGLCGTNAELVTAWDKIEQLKAENDALSEAFDAMHKHRYDSECDVCNKIVALLQKE